MTVYDRGAQARANRALAAPLDGVDPGSLLFGHYLVRTGAHWRVSRWLPQANRWDAGGGFAWPRRYWQEIGAKVA